MLKIRKESLQNVKREDYYFDSYDFVWKGISDFFDKMERRFWR